jgi:hypothetical protein
VSCPLLVRGALRLNLFGANAARVQCGDDADQAPAVAAGGMRFI